MAAGVVSPWERYLRPVIASVVEVLQPTLVIDNLFAKKVIHRVEYEDIVGNKATLPESAKARFLLSRLMSKGHEEFKTFLQVLHQTEGQSHVADVVEKEMSLQVQATPVGGASTIPQAAAETGQSDPHSIPGEEQRTDSFLSAVETPSVLIQSSVAPEESETIRGGAASVATPTTRHGRKRVVFFVKKSHRVKFLPRRNKLHAMCCEMFGIKKEDFKVYYEDPPDKVQDSEIEEEDIDSDDLHAFVSHNYKVVCLMLHGISKAQFTGQLDELIDTITTFLRISSDDVEVESMIEKSVLVFLRLPMEAVLDLLCAFADPQSFSQLQTAVQTAVPLASDAILKVGSLPSLTLFTKDGSSTHPLVQPTDDGFSDVKEMFEACQTGDYELIEDLHESGVSLTIFNEDGQQPIHVASNNNQVKVVELLLDKGIPVDSRDKMGSTALHFAAVTDSIQVGNILVKTGHSIEIINTKGETPLHTAAVYNSLNVASLLLDKRINVDCREQNDWTPLHFTAQYNSSDVAQLLLQHNCEVDSRTNRQSTPLHITAGYNSSDVARLLLQHNCDVDARLKDNWTPLHITAWQNSSDVAQLLLQHNCEVDARLKDNWTPLHITAWQNSSDVAQLLLQHNCEVDARLKDNWTPLHITAWQNSSDVAQLLLQHNCEVDARQKDNWTPLHFTAQYNSSDVAQLLLQHNCEVDARQKDDWTPLHITAQRKSSDVAQLLLQHNCEVDARTNRLSTPLHITAEHNSSDVARLLLQHNCEVDARQTDNLTPLHFTAQYNSSDVARLLLQHNCEVDARAINQSTPLHTATREGYVNIVKFLLKHNADVSARETGGGAALDIACHLERHDCALLLLEAGSPVDNVVRFLLQDMRIDPDKPKAEYSHAHKEKGVEVLKHTGKEEEKK